MNPVFTFILGLLIGWLIEWVIDFYYWRRRDAGSQRAPAARISSVRGGDEKPPVASVPDDLKVIRGIGPAIERRLNEAGIYTYEQLGNLTVSQLRRILGDAIERLANEDALLEQARDLARRK